MLQFHRFLPLISNISRSRTSFTQNIISTKSFIYIRRSIMAQAPTNDNDNKEDGSQKECRLFFVYGTLRDDLELVNPKETLTYYGIQWFKGEYEACYAQLKGYKMYRHVELPYPFIVETKNDKDIILGRLVKFVCDENHFKNKLAHADSIEGYDPDKKDSKSNLYQRGMQGVKIVSFPYKIEEKKGIKDKYPKDAKMFKENSEHDAYFYYQTTDAKTLLNNDEYDCVDTGDWIKRPAYEYHEQFVDKKLEN